MKVNPCFCGSTQITVDAVLVEHQRQAADGSSITEWLGEELGAVHCAECGREMRLGAAMTVALMHHLVEKKYQEEAGRV